MYSHDRHHERGSVTTEFVLVTPLLAFAMLFLMGLGYTLMTKQNAIVGARAAVYYRAPRTQPPPVSTMNELIKDAVSPGREDWTLDFAEGHMEDPEMSRVSNAASSFYQTFNKEMRYTARGTASLGLLPRIMNLGQAESAHYLPRGTWTCAQTKGGDYASITLGALGVPPPLNGWFDLSCCETYPASYR